MNRAPVIEPVTGTPAADGVVKVFVKIVKSGPKEVQSTKSLGFNWSLDRTGSITSAQTVQATKASNSATRKVIIIILLEFFFHS
jgi:hypothetical protein